MEPSQYALEVGDRLRATRMALGLSLHAAEVRSGGKHKAVVIGSYERGNRALTLGKLAALADFYRVPVSSLLPDDDPEADQDTVTLARAIRAAGLSAQDGRQAMTVLRQMVAGGAFVAGEKVPA